MGNQPISQPQTQTRTEQGSQAQQMLFTQGIFNPPVSVSFKSFNQKALVKPSVSSAKPHFPMSHQHRRQGGRNFRTIMSALPNGKDESPQVQKLTNYHQKFLDNHQTSKHISIKDLAQAKRFTSEPAVDEYNRYMNLIQLKQEQMAKIDRETLKNKIKLDQRIIIDQTSSQETEKLETITSNASKMDFQIDPNNFQDAKQLIEFAEHLKKIHNVIDITTDDQTVRIQEAINRNLNQNYLERVQEVQEIQKKDQKEENSSQNLSDEQRKILEKMGVKYDHLEDSSEETKNSESNKQKTQSDQYFGASWKFQTSEDSDIDLQDTSSMPKSLESAIRILRKQIKEASSEILLMKQKIDSIRKQEESPAQKIFIQKTMNSYKAALLSHKSMTDMLRKAQSQLKVEKEQEVEEQQMKDYLYESNKALFLEKQDQELQSELDGEMTQALRDAESEVEALKRQVRERRENLEKKQQNINEAVAKEEELMNKLDESDDPAAVRRNLMKELGQEGTLLFASDGPEFSINEDYMDDKFEVFQQGWGSDKKGTLDPETGKLASVKRTPSMKDYWEAAGYLNFLEAQFQVQEEEIDQAYNNSQEYGVNMFKDREIFEQIVTEVEEIAMLVGNFDDKQFFLNDPEIMIKNLTKLNQKVLKMHQAIYKFEEKYQQKISGQYINMNSYIIHNIKKIRRAQNIYDLETKNLIEQTQRIKSSSQKQEDEANFKQYQIKEDGPDSMIIVVEPDDCAPEFILFDPLQDKLPEMVDSQASKEKMSAQHLMYKSIIEKVKKEQEDKAKENAQMQVRGMEQKMLDAIEKKKQFLDRQVKLKMSLNTRYKGKKDERTNDWEGWNTYMTDLIRIYKQKIVRKGQEPEFGEVYMKVNGEKIPMNFKNFVIFHPDLSLTDKNQLIQLHNTAHKDDQYGLRLFKFAEKLIDQGKLEKDEEQRVVGLSIEWPVDVQVDLLIYNPNNPKETLKSMGKQDSDEKGNENESQEKDDDKK